MDSDPEVLKTEGFHMFNAGVDFSKAVTTLKTGLTSLEEGDTPPWGDDDIGERFGVVYEGLRDGMYDSMGSLAERIAGMGVAFTRMGVAHEQNEAERDAVWRETMAEYDGRVRMAPGGVRGELRTRPST
jgi:hypothetical protein